MYRGGKGGDQITVGIPQGAGAVSEVQVGEEHVGEEHVGDVDGAHAGCGETVGEGDCRVDGEYVAPLGVEAIPATGIDEHQRVRCVDQQAAAGRGNPVAGVGPTGRLP